MSNLRDIENDIKTTPGQVKPPPNGWKRLWIIISVLWVVQAVIAIFLVGIAFATHTAKKGLVPDVYIGLPVLLAFFALYLAGPPYLAKWAGVLISRMASGNNEFSFASLTPARKAWFVLAGACYAWFFLPGIAYLAFTLGSFIAGGVGALPPEFARVAGIPFVNTMINLPAWAALTFGSYLLMRLVDWIWAGFSAKEQGRDNLTP